MSYENPESIERPTHEESGGSVDALGRFIVRMAVDYKLLRKYLEDTEVFLLPIDDDDGELLDLEESLYDEKTLKDIEQRSGLTPNHVEMIRRGNWKAMFRTLAKGDRPMGEDQTNYP